MGLADCGGRPDLPDTQMRRITQGDKLQKYREFYAGEGELSSEEKDYLTRYEDIQEKLEDEEYTRSDVVKYVQNRYQVSKQMANRLVNEAADLYGDIVEVHKKAERGFQIAKLQRAASIALNPPDQTTVDEEGNLKTFPGEQDLAAYERIMNQINKLQGLYEQDPEETEDPAAYEVPAVITYEVLDIPYEDVTTNPAHPDQSGAAGLPAGTPAE
jgi:hypothetical protein